MTTKRLAAALALCIVGAALSLLLLLEHHGEGQSLVDAVCGEGAGSGCETVARSPQAKIAGVPWAALGLFSYLALAALLGLALAAPDPTRPPAAGLAFAIVIAALVVDLGLLGVQAFALKAFCSLCLATYAVNGALLAVLWPARSAVRVLRGAMGDASGRLAATAWIIGVLGLGAAVFTADWALASRAAARAGSLLGAPVPAPAAPTLPGDAEGARWRAEARRLQETLDDPQKLEQHFADKAAREYESAAVQRLDVQDVPAKGPSGAPVQVVEFSDFLCPFCRDLAGAFHAFLPQSGNRVRLYFKNYPLDQSCNSSVKNTAHPGACWLALGAICAQYQGRFWEYHDKVFSSALRSPQPAEVVTLAAAAGLNAAAVEACVQDPRTSQRLAAEIAEGSRAGVQSTPTVFINGKKLPRLTDFVAVVGKEAQAKGFPPLAAGPRK